MPLDDSARDVSRRALLKASGGALALFGTGSVHADGDDHPPSPSDCPDATFEPSMVHYDHSSMDFCDDDHLETQRLKQAVADTLENRFPTVGALIDEGYVPYFDFAIAEGEGGWSHWLNPEYIGDDGVLDPERPESVLVDHEWWRPIGVMFIATRDHEHVDSPPAVYSTNGGNGDSHLEDEHGDGHDDDDGHDDHHGDGHDDDDDHHDHDDHENGQCAPWHAHAELPARYSWWKYQVLYGNRSGMDKLELPCQTPWMMHVWTYPNPDGVYAHGAPPQENRGGPPAEDPGFETDAVPGEDELGRDVLLDVLSHKAAHRLNG